MRSKPVVVALSCLLLAPAALARDLTLRLPDGSVISGAVDGEGTTSLVLATAPASDNSTWSAVRASLAARGVQVVTVTPRQLATDADRTPQVADVQAAVQWARQQGATRIVLGGEGLSGNVALHVAAQDPAITSFVWVSPRLSARGLDLVADLDVVVGRPMMVIAGVEDTTGVRAAGAIAHHLGDRATVETVDKGQTGPDLLARSPHLEGKLIAWVNDTSPEALAGRPATALDPARLDTLETTGKRYGE